MDEQDDNWDDYIDGALFAINTNVYLFIYLFI